MDVNSSVTISSPDNETQADGNIYEHIYLNVRQDADTTSSICNSISAQQFHNTTDGPLQIIYEHEEQLPPERTIYSLKDESDVILNSNATEDESMAVEALRQLGNTALYAKTPQVLPLLACSNCEAQFQNVANFQNHSTICKHGQLKCYICNETFERIIDFNNHLVCHAVERPHSCRICSTLFVHEKDFTEHLQTHDVTANANRCRVCGVEFNRPSSLTNHMKIHTYRPGRALVKRLPPPKVGTGRNCTDISGNERNAENITIPTLHNISNWDEYDMPHTEDFKAEVNLEVAQELTVDNFEDDKKNVVSIIYEYVNDESVGYHEEEITSTEIKPHRATSENVNASNNNKRPYLCKYCNKSFAREKALISHHKLHSSVLQTYYQCKNCNEQLTDEESLVKHASNCVDKTQQNASAPDITVARNIQKPHVTLVENSKTKFYKHACPHCGKRFSTKQKLHRHMWIHRKKLFMCEICACSFEKQEELDSHRLSTHQGNSAYVCNECGKCFSSRQGLWEHNRIHGNNSHLYTCAQCTKTFSSRQGYLIHKRAHNDERPYGCRFCWKSFRDGGTLRKHERIHTGERPHACPLCARAFNQKVVLREHVRWLHTANRQPNESGVYDCTLCEQTLTDKDDLCAHIVKHSDHLALLAKDASKNNIKLSADAIDSNENKRKHKKVKDKVVIEIIPSVNTDSNDAVNVEDRSEKSLIECDLCGDKFVAESDLSEHVRIHI